jgi:O-antigen ligase
VFQADPRSWARWAALLYIPAGTIAILFTASRGGLVACLVALAGCAVLLFRNHRRLVIGSGLVLPLFVLCVSLLLPAGSLARLASIAGQLQGGDLNQRVNIWDAGWHAFLDAPFFGHGAGTFVSAAGLAPIDTAHNTVLSVLVEGGLAGLLIGVAVVACAIAMAFTVRGALRIALLTELAVLCVASMVGTTGENRLTWLLFALIGAAYRLSTVAESPYGACAPALAQRVQS